MHEPGTRIVTDESYFEAQADAAWEASRNGAGTSPRDLAATSPETDLATSPDPLGRGEVEQFADDLAAKSSSWTPVDVVEAAANPPAPPDIIDLFYRGKNHVVVGESEAMKTWLALAATAAEINAGRGVLWVDGDEVGSDDLLERLRLFGVGDTAISELFAYVFPDESLGPHLPGVFDVIRDRDVRLAIFDGFNPLLVLEELDPNSGIDVEKFYGLIAPIKRLGVANVLTDNVVKSREARDGWAIGSERKRSKAEVQLVMSTLTPLVRGGAGRSKITVKKDRPGFLERPSPGILVIESSTVFSWRLQPDDSRSEEGKFRPTGLMTKVSRFLERRWNEPQSRSQIEKAKLGGTEYVRQAVDCLIEEGFAQEHEGPRGARLVEFVRPFHEGDNAGADAA